LFVTSAQKLNLLTRHNEPRKLYATHPMHTINIIAISRTNSST